MDLLYDRWMSPVGVMTAIRSWSRRWGLLRRWWVRRRFPVEVALIEGRHSTRNEHPSIVHFSVVRAATQYIKSILFRCGAAKGMTPVSLHGYSFQSNFPFLSSLDSSQMSRYRQLFKSRGYVYCDFHELVEGVDFTGYRVLLVVRDPRDSLTSGFYSMAFSHVPPWEREKIEVFEGRRQAARSMGIDQYVMAECERVRDIYQRYLQWLEEHDEVYVSTYERMVTSFEPWLDDLLEFCELEIDAHLRSELIDEARIQPVREDVTRHKRQIEPGDFRRKLSNQTIEELNRRLRSVLDGFGYRV